ncbi:hypothetical protein NSK_000733 [Nannochloropsis salina CCMP1776]|uniref:Isovaleryl-CoA dehydrogenase n=1 Tax=Nannochloropsis salina CCMP1776 TaxID=1027361 RepID=A0A4D9DBL2_9STRA|nr:hypothetical protein NSK_000733 [Nannochloropsis salina CCMP1776]|eukprot:TFJ88384.1 hypothetical protein NSK_000733 [Nannochloropsis salina CCMP1776]
MLIGFNFSRRAGRARFFPPLPCPSFGAATPPPLNAQRSALLCITTTATKHSRPFVNQTPPHRFSSEPVPSPPVQFDPFNPTEEHTHLRTTVRAFVEKEVDPQALAFNRREEFNLPLFRKLGELGLLGLSVPAEYGGSGMDATAVAIAHEELSAADPAFCLAYLAHSLLFVNNLAQNGSHAQKSKYLPAACAGTAVGGMCMSEPGAGTDVLGMGTAATKASDGSHYILNGAKMWITNGTVDGQSTGDVYLVYAKTGQAAKDVSMFLVEKGSPGFRLGQKLEDKLGMRASMTAELVFDDCRVPVENLVGKEDGAAACMMRNLEIERVGLAAMSVGLARRCVEIMNAYAKERKAFGQPLNAFGQVQRHVAESYAEYMAGRAYLYYVANQLDLSSSGNGLDADGVKLYCAKMGKEVADRAIQVLGGYGYVGEYQVERLWRDAKLLEIGGGTNEAHHKNMVRDLRKHHERLL